MPSQILIRDPTLYPKQSRDTSSAAEGLVGGDDIASVSTTVFIQPEGSDRRKDTRRVADASLLLNDISASPRLFGYCVCLVSAIVSMISSSIFYTNGTVEPPTLETVEEYYSFNASLTSEQKELTIAWDRALNNQSSEHFFGVNGNMVRKWKVWGAIAVSSLMSLVTLLVVIAHFDSYFCPRKFRSFFADGSKSERNLLFVLIAISVCSLQTNTSRFSVGEAQANVFFSTWTSFVALIFNYELWRTNAGRHLTFQNVLFDANFPTKRFWLPLAIFSTIALLAFIEHILHNNFLGVVNCNKLTFKSLWLWLAVFSCSLPWGFLYYRNRRLTDVTNPKLLWMVETTFACALVAVNGTAISNFTGGVSDKIPCPSNLYFGLWGAFVVAVWVLGGLLQSNHWI